MVPLIRSLSGRHDVAHPLEPAILGAGLSENDHRQEYLRARLELRQDGLPVATAITQQDSSLQANLSAAQALIVRLPHAPAASAGSACTIVKLPL
jgi:molybdopterin molybdotransferase